MTQTYFYLENHCCKNKAQKVIFAVEITLMDKNALLGLSKNN